MGGWLVPLREREESQGGLTSGVYTTATRGVKGCRARTDPISDGIYILGASCSWDGLKRASNKWI